MSELTVEPVTKQNYFTESNHISNSMLAQFIECRRTYEGRYVTGTIDPRKSTKQMDLGTSIHSALLDGRPLRSCVAIYNDRNQYTAMVKGITKASRESMSDYDKSQICMLAKISTTTFNGFKTLKELKAELMPRMPQQHIGSDGSVTPTGRFFEEDKKREGYCQVVKRNEFSQMQEAINCLRNSEVWQWIESDKTICEEPIVWENEQGQLCKCRPDFLIPLSDRTLIFDLKVTAFHRPNAWRKQVEQNKRNITQPVHYSKGAFNKYGKPVDWRWVTLNPNVPITLASVCVHRLSYSAYQKCEAFYDHHMQEMKEAEDYSASYETEEVEVELRDFAFRD